MIYVLYSPASRQQIKDMLEAGTNTVKVVVDIRLGILAGGGELHCDCETTLLAEGCQQEDLWGQVGIWLRAKLILAPSSISVLGKKTIHLCCKTRQHKHASPKSSRTC
ncbi:MAG: hypothetical protein HYR56_07140 [Acidobacteria bacterium]|nr:hypothetical protein [Acidobacteriota bacterium]MBI3427978.1 hypothetical protein [Acidobacteriota bacterium]